MVSLNDVRSGKCTRDLLERLPIGHNRTTNQRTNARAKKGKSEDRVRKGGGPAGRRAGGEEAGGRPINNAPDFMGSFSLRKKRQVEASWRATSAAFDDERRVAVRPPLCWAQIWEAIMQIVRAKPRNFSNTGSDG